LAESGRSIQWCRLLVLTAAHFYVDMFAGMIPAILPRLRVDFDMSLRTGAILIAFMHIICNTVQIPVGYARNNKRTPLFLFVGVAFAASLCLLSLAAQSDMSVFWLFIIAAVTGLGIGFVHPESFRAVFETKKISVSVSTAVFVTGGMLGFGTGAWVSTKLVTNFGLSGLCWLASGAVVIIAGLIILKIRLAVDEKHDKTEPVDRIRALPFWSLWLMSIPAATATTVLGGLLPSRLGELGFELEFGGFCNMLFIAGGIGGTLFWAVVARKREIINVCVFTFFLGISFLVIYLFNLEHRGSAWLLLPSGFCVLASQPLMVSLARYAKGLSLGGRMGFIAGGTWGVASLILMVLGVAAEKWGIKIILNWVWMGYLISAIIGIWIMYNNKR